MKDHYCLNCGKALEEGKTVCPACRFDNGKESLSAMDVHEYKKLCYNGIGRSRTKIDQGRTFYVIGGILLILGIVFLVLSFRYNVLRQRVFTPLSCEFIACVLGLALGIASLVFASIKVLPARKRRTFYQSKIDKRP